MARKDLTFSQVCDRRGITPDILTQLIELLTDLETRALRGEHIPTPTSGICGNIERMVGNYHPLRYQVVSLVSAAAQTWEHPDRDECDVYPIKFSRSMWQGNCLEQRLSLISHLVKVAAEERDAIRERQLKADVELLRKLES